MPLTNHPLPPAPGVIPRENPGYGYGYGYGYGNSSQHSRDLARTWHALVEKAWVVALCLVVLVGIGYVYTRNMPVLYSATATVQAEQDQPNILKMDRVQIRDVQAVDYLQTVAQSLTSRPLLELIANTNQLWTDPRFLTGGRVATNRDQVLDALEKMVQVKLRRGTRLIDITVVHRVPELTAKIANSIIAAYLNSRAEQEGSAISVANESLSREAERLRKKLEQSQQALQDYKEQFNASSLDDRQNTVVAKLQELSTKATEAKSTRIKIETDYAQVLKLGTNIPALLNVPSIASDPTLLSLQSSLIKAEDDFTVLRQRYMEKHPRYIQARTQISELGTDITNAVLNAVKTLNGSLVTAKSAEQGLEAAMQSQQTASLELSKLAIQHSVLAREVESDRSLYDAVLMGMKEAWVTKETQQSGVIRPIEPAYPPEKPLSAHKAATLAMCGLAGMFLGVLIVLGLRVTDTSIKTVDEAEAILGLSVFSVVPNMSELKNGHSRLVVAEQARSQGAEAFRTLRTSLSTLGHTKDLRVSMFTSAMPSEGKTFCSVNYSASLAQLGRKCLLIDADLRKPAVEATIMGHETSNPGLTDLLTGQKTLNEVIQPTKIENFFFISAGSTAVNPAELLARDGFNSVIQDALLQFDYVVVDSAPVNAVSDTLLMLKSVQTVCLVVRAARTSSRYVVRCVQMLQSAEASLSGVILNRMPRRGGFGYGAYYDYQHHGKYGKEGVYGKA